jgi:hypothetical protein
MNVAFLTGTLYEFLVHGGCAGESKSNKIRSAWAAGNQIGALRIAACFFDRSADTRIFKRGMDAHRYPNFYRQLGQEALHLLAVKFRLGAPDHCPEATGAKQSACRESW